MAWQPRESGNPAGKKPGTGTVAALRASIAEHVPAIAGTLTDQGRAVMAAAATGELTPTQAAQLLAGLSALAKLVETDDLVKRVQA